VLVRIKDALIDAKEATTPQEHAIGLSKTDSLADGEGMLFPFEKEEARVFWMPASMKFSLDILFIGVSSDILTIFEDCEPGCPMKFRGLAKWVLEVPAGFCKKMGIEPGDTVTFDEEEIELDAQVSSDILRTLSTASKKTAALHEDQCQLCKGLGCRCMGCPACKEHEMGLHGKTAQVVLSDGIIEAIEEIKSKTDQEIDIATAEKWKDRACAAYYLAANEENVDAHCLLLTRGGHLKDEALEHAAMAHDDGVTLKAIEAEIREYEEMASADKIAQASPYLRAKSPNTVAQSQSVETSPYSREPSKAPARPTERFREHDTFDEVIPEGGKRVTVGPIHDEEWNSPTRAS
jgi:uncharacterized membrane protein (UPF0127 family)